MPNPAFRQCLLEIVEARVIDLDVDEVQTFKVGESSQVPQPSVGDLESLGMCPGRY